MSIRTHSALLLFCLILPTACERSSDTAASDAAPSSAAEDTGSQGRSAVAIQQALSSPDPFVRAEQLGALLPTLGPDAVDDVHALLRSFPFELGAVEFELLLSFWASHDAEQATNWVIDKSPTLYRIHGIRSTIEPLARTDPAAAVAAVERVQAHSDEMARVAQIALVRGWFDRDPDELLEYIVGRGAGVPQQRGLYAFALSLASRDGSEALIEWAEAFPDEDPRLKRTVYQQTASALSWLDSPKAALFCEAHCDGPHGFGIREILVRSRLNQGDDGGEVVEWVKRTAAENERKSHTLWVAYTTWALYEPEAAIAWMEERLDAAQNEAWLKPLFAEYTRQLAADDPARSMAMAQQIEDEVDRERTMIRIARHWRRVDEEAAEAWLADSPFDEKTRTFIRESRRPIYLPRVQP